ncbi:glycosyltransferase family 4 protein [Desulfitibacter alkalitolerans]|uniref:glycosyltransferase family 4 protein n=1 Tax=Desulfitibacter alkalitolerans TaxID=264641 RepID=UPI0009FD82B6|nr:glycosyltransferase family 4 protein [Desulfitibacter alkalitolerans]
MKILMLSWEYPPQSVGGLARHVKDLSLALGELVNEVHILTRGAEEASFYEENQGIHIHRVYSLPLQTPDFMHWVSQLNFALIEKGIEILQNNEFDIIHGHDWLVAYAARVLKHSYKLPLVATIHATEAGRNHGLHSPLQNFIHSIEWFLGYESWKVIVCSKHMEGEVKGLFGLPQDKIVRIPNGVYVKQFAELDKFNHNWSIDSLASVVRDNEKVLFFVGRLVREKGVHILIDSLPLLLQEFPEIKLIVAGTGPMEGQLKHQVKRMGLEHKVHFTGYIDDTLLKQLFKRADIAVFPSLYEPFGIVALEAMASATPVIVSDTGGLSEIVSHGKNGLKFIPGNPNSLADQVKAILRDEKFAQSLAATASENVISEYDWSSIAKKTHTVYESIKEEYEKSDWYMEKNLPKKLIVSPNTALNTMRNPSRNILN